MTNLMYTGDRKRLTGGTILDYGESYDINIYHCKGMYIVEVIDKDGDPDPEYLAFRSTADLFDNWCSPVTAKNFITIDSVKSWAESCMEGADGNTFDCMCRIVDAIYEYKSFYKK